MNSRDIWKHDENTRDLIRMIESDLKSLESNLIHWEGHDLVGFKRTQAEARVLRSILDYIRGNAIGEDIGQ